MVILVRFSKFKVPQKAGTEIYSIVVKYKSSEISGIPEKSGKVSCLYPGCPEHAELNLSSSIKYKSPVNMTKPRLKNYSGPHSYRNLSIKFNDFSMTSP